MAGWREERKEIDVLRATLGRFYKATGQHGTQWPPSSPQSGICPGI